MLFDHCERHFGVFGGIAIDAQAPHRAKVFAHDEAAVDHKGVNLTRWQRFVDGGTACRASGSGVRHL